VLVLGDSFCRIYNTRAASLGETTGAESADAGEAAPAWFGGFRLAAGAGLGVRWTRLSAMAGSTDVREKLGHKPEILEGKTVVIWEFVERDIGLAARMGGVPLPLRWSERMNRTVDIVLFGLYLLVNSDWNVGGPPRMVARAITSSRAKDCRGTPSVVPSSPPTSAPSISSE